MSQNFREKIAKSFQDLLIQANNIEKIEEIILVPDHNSNYTNAKKRETRIEINSLQFKILKTQVLSLIHMLSNGENKHLEAVYEEVQGTWTSINGLQTVQGVLEGLKKSFESGFLDKLADIFEANVAADYLGQAEQLLKEGQSGTYDHVPAAVLTGAILENALRKLCDRQSPPISVLKSNSEPKTLNILIDDLKKVNLYNELKAKQLRSWADIRNAAAHGEFDKFKRTDVEQMIVGIQNFLAEFL